MGSRKLFMIAMAMLTAASVFAAQAAFTGFDYLKMDSKQRVNTVKIFKEEAGKQGVAIKKDPIFYCKALDAFYAKNPNMKKEPFVNVLKTLVIMEYDWDKKGVDKDALARQWLGDANYKANKARMAGAK
jgi:hypothetical protein